MGKSKDNFNLIIVLAAVCLLLGGATLFFWYNSAPSDEGVQLPSSGMITATTEIESLQTEVNSLEVEVGQLTNELRDEKGRARLSLMFDGWGAETFESDTAYFYFYIMNYGDVEARGVKVRCYAQSNVTDEVLTHVTADVNNVASRSSSYDYGIVEWDGQWDPDNTLGACRIVDCADCEILDDKIPVFANQHPI